MNNSIYSHSSFRKQIILQEDMNQIMKCRNLSSLSEGIAARIYIYIFLLTSKEEFNSLYLSGNNSYINHNTTTCWSTESRKKMMIRIQD